MTENTGKTARQRALAALAEIQGVRLYALNEFDGEPAEATALVWAEDPDEARWLAKEKTGKRARVIIEIGPERGVAALFGLGAHAADEAERGVQA